MNATAIRQHSSPNDGLVWQRGRRGTGFSAPRPFGGSGVAPAVPALRQDPARAALAFRLDAYYASERVELPL